MTRAIMHIHHFEFTEGFYFNYLSFAVYPFLVYMWFQWTIAAMKRRAWLAPDFSLIGLIKKAK